MRALSWFAVLGLAVAVAPLGCSLDGGDDAGDAVTTGDVTAEDELRSLTLTEADDGRTITLARGQDLVVKLQSNPTTGFRWTVASTTRALGEPTSRFLPNGDGVGATGVTRLVWKTKDALEGRHRVTLEYRRPWDENASPAKTFSFEVTFVEAECPELAPPAPDFCREGRIRATKDANGCTTSLECAPDCRATGCDAGRTCSYCWTQFACIPNGAQC